MEHLECYGGPLDGESRPWSGARRACMVEAVAGGFVRYVAEQDDTGERYWCFAGVVNAAQRAA